MAANSSPLRRDEMTVIDLSMSSPNSSPTPGESKRKHVLADDGNGTELTPSPVKKQKTSEGRVEVKGKKVIFRQDPYQRVLPRRQLLNFEAWVLDSEEEGTKPTAIPDEFHSTIAMAGHELTSTSEAAFVKALKSELVKDSNNALLSDLLATLVPQLFTLKQYGFHPSDFGVGASRFPAGFQIRCWEVNDLEKHFPADRIPELLVRRTERETARRECEGILAGMNDEAKAELLKGEWSGSSSPVKPAVVTHDDGFKKEDTPKSALSSPLKAPSTGAPSRLRSLSPSKSNTPSKPAKKLSPEEEEEARKKQEEREAKKAEKEEKRKEQEEKRQQREEKKAAKERQQQKKAEVKAKQAQTFSSFFSKPKQPAVVKPEVVAAPSSGVSDFQRAFRPPPQRANVEWAPVNFFSTRSSRRSGAASDVSTWTAKDFIADHLRRHEVDAGNTRNARPRGLKSTPRYGTVADMWTTYQEAEDPRAVLAELRDKRKFPWKTLAFDQQARPPYVGTFTKKSLTVGPRTPFAQDPVFDYSYDSGDDWQDEDEGGDDVDDPVQNEEGDEEGEDEEDGEFDDWLDDSEETVLVAEGDGDVLMAEASRNSPPRPKPKKKLAPKRITKLTPTWRGPLWENVIAEPFEGLEEYRIQLLNDTPDCIDPFTYVAADPLPQFKTTYSDTMIGLQTRVPCLISAGEVNAPKNPIPKPSAPAMPLGDASSSANKLVIKRHPKVAFPQSRMPEFLRLVEGNSRILTDLVSQLKIRFDKVTTKAAIEAKIREVAVREGKSKDSKWKVKPEAWTAAGITVPPHPVAALATATADS